MRFEIVASKGKDVVYKKTTNPIDAQIIAWELKMQGYKVKTITNETEVII